MMGIFKKKSRTKSAKLSLAEELLRQGDVLLKPVAKLPEGLVESKNPILAYGEKTGHSHRVTGQIQVFRDKIESRPPPHRTFIQGEGQLLHEEHGTVNIPSGVYEVVRQRQYDPTANRLVND